MVYIQQKSRVYIAFFLVILLILFWFQSRVYIASAPAEKQQIVASVSGFTPDHQIKFDQCMPVDGLPDHDCTPGAIFSDVTEAQICQSGYAKSVRNVSETTKNNVYKEYTIASHTTGEYEVDHLISLELGGSNDISNLWPEAANPTPGFHEKDKVENYLHDQVCSGIISLSEAQREISTNWVEVYQKINK